MAELEPGNPDELVAILHNWLRQAQLSPDTLPDRMDNVEWAVRQFINYWQSPTRIALESVEESLQRALMLCHSGAPSMEIANEIASIRQTIECDLKDHLGLTPWHRS